MNRRSLRTAVGAPVLAAALAAVLALGVGACSAGDVDADSAGPSESSSPTQPPPGPDDVQYVALGDSYASAPGVPDSDPAGGCFRSSSNYAHVLADSADLYLTDATCSGADSDEIIAEQVPQIGPDTDIVTVGTGGNDFDLFIQVLTGCLTRGDSAAGSVTCSDVVGNEIAPQAAAIQAKMGEVLDAILAAAPEAAVYVVGYPGLLPESGTCPDLVPMAAEDYPVVESIIVALSDGLRAEADARGLDFVDVLAASRGHDICSDDPWVNGARVADDGTVPFHPFGVEQAAVADLIAAML